MSTTCNSLSINLASVNWTKVFVAFAALTLALLSIDVHAALPTDNTGLLPDDLADTSTPADIGVSMGRWAVVGFLTLLAGGAVLATMYQSVVAYNNASSGRSGWGQFGMTVIIGVIVIGVCVAIAILGAQYVAP